MPPTQILEINDFNITSQKPYKKQIAKKSLTNIS